MNILKGSRVYLAGAVDNDPHAKNWRASLTEDLLKPLGITVYDPLVKPYWMSDVANINPRLYYTYLESDQSKQQLVFNALGEIRKVCLAAVAASDFMICHLPRSTFTFGTMIELDRHYLANKPVFFHCPEGIPSTWALDQFSDCNTWKEIFFSNWNDLCGHIRKINNGKINLDPIKWFSIAHRLDELSIWISTESQADLNLIS